ncbi:hypothetical protein FDP41_005781 [Naegleria fowleri]|uniref:D-lactate dehydrogenase n=1 Tax=Naegleria fowleri TaxID=5763 RepID=A0A6A5BLI7_NAEFO|nr:uncharacterized protein FDP41_005781 [Naegleria fowleri]KAF0975028.1 hypothetical protein FDP41_005781 [Naegleria fowleri]
MKIAVFSAKPYDEEFLNQCNETLREQKHTLKFIKSALDESHAVLAKGSDAVCVFVNDPVGESVIDSLAELGIKLILCRCAGYNNVNLKACKKHGITVARVPKYSPYATAEHSVALMLTLNRKTHRAYNRVREGDFSINGLMGFDMNGKNVGIIGTGKIGMLVCKILKCGFGCNVVAYDVYQSQEVKDLGIEYVDLDTLFKTSDIISLHCPLLPSTKYIINDDALEKMKKGVMIINASRGGLLDTKAVIKHLKNGKVGSLGIDTYEHEANTFYENHSAENDLNDELLLRLMSFKNVLVTSHQAFFTQEAMKNIADSVLSTAGKFQKDHKITGEEYVPYE